MDIEELYDEFGNYIGPDQSDSESSSGLPDDPLQANNPTANTNKPPTNDVDGIHLNDAHPSVNGNVDAPHVQEESQAIVLAEDKQLFPAAEEVFGPDTEVLIEEEDAQPITEPLVAPIIEPSSGLHEKPESIPESLYSRTFLTTAVLPYPSRTRNVALVGHLHHGKTSFVDMLFDATHKMPWAGLDDRDLPVRYMDTRHDEQKLHLSIKTTAATFLLQTSQEKSFGVTVLDAPGHPNFLDEAIAALSLADGAVVVIDVAEGLLLGTEVILRRAAQLHLDIVLVISKLDRLCLELRLPPNDAYHKIRHIIDSCNEIIAPFSVSALSPAKGNVAFSSSSERVCFTLQQFARSYVSANGGEERFPLSSEMLARRFWGDVYYDDETRKFSNRNLGASKRTFVSFILEPFYKLHTAVVSEDVDQLTSYLRRNDLLGEKMRRRTRSKLGNVPGEAIGSDLKTMLREVNRSCFSMGDMSGFIEMLVSHVKSPLESADRKISSLSKVGYDVTENPSDLVTSWVKAMKECNTDAEKPLSAYVGKLLPDEKGLRFDCVLRVLSGKLRIRDSISVLGQSYDKDSNHEDHSVAQVDSIFVPCGRFKIEVDEAAAGQVVLVRGLDQTIYNSATVVSKTLTAKRESYSLRSLREFLPPGAMKVAVEPVKPGDLPKMVSSLRQCMNSYIGLETKVEETGEHTLIGSGELYMDCVLRDLRTAYEEVEVKVSDPVVPFAETVSETSAIQCYADTPNGQNKLVMIAEPLEEAILEGLKTNSFEGSGDLPFELRERGFDALAARSLWTFGPDKWRGPNALLNDVLDDDMRVRVEDIRDTVVQGFNWAVREGPLTDEPVRGVKVRLLDATIGNSAVQRSGAQIIPTSRRVVFSSVLTAAPRLMEPVNIIEILCERDAVQVAHTLVSRRRGHVIGEDDVAGTPFRRLLVHMPVLDSFGFEPDLRTLTHGTAFCVQMFDHWGVMPGDPLDRNVELRPLEPARRHELARECMVKTRRRKGLDDDVSVTKYFDDPLLVELMRDNEELRNLL